MNPPAIRLDFELHLSTHDRFKALDFRDGIIDHLRKFGFRLILVDNGTRIVMDHDLSSQPDNKIEET